MQLRTRRTENETAGSRYAVQGHTDKMKGIPVHEVSSLRQKDESCSLLRRYQRTSNLQP